MECLHSVYCYVITWAYANGVNWKGEIEIKWSQSNSHWRKKTAECAPKTLIRALRIHDH